MTNRMGFYRDRFCEWDGRMCVSASQTSKFLPVRLWFRLISRLGDGIFWYALLLGIVLSQGNAGLYPALHMASAGFIGTVIYKWLKGRTLRPRPYEVHQDVWLTGKPLDRFSFPSGHTLHAVAFCTVGLFYYPALWPLLLSFTIMVALSRVVLGLHYPSDVLAGAAIGALIAVLSITATM